MKGLFKQMLEYFEKSFFPKNQCRFRKSFSAQYCLVAMLEKWKSVTDNKKLFGALLSDLSKAFEYDLLIVKLNAYGFNISACDLYIVIFKIVCKEQK